MSTEPLVLDILIDTREQTPWSWPDDLVRAERATLRVGDYALYGDRLFAVERKSLPDFAHSVSSGWPNMLDRIDRMTGAGEYAGLDGYPPMVGCPMIVEATVDGMINGRLAAAAEGHGVRATPQFLAKRAAELLFLGVPVFFAGPPHVAAWLAYTILRQRRRALDAQQTEKGNDDD